VRSALSEVIPTRYFERAAHPGCPFTFYKRLNERNSIMKRSTFFTIASGVALAIGFFALSAPGVLIADVKMAAPAAVANVMARTAGVLLITVGILGYLVRNDEDSPTFRSVLIANLILQLGLLPVDPIAYATGVYGSLGSFVPNTVIHILLAGGFAHYLAAMKVTRQSPAALPAIPSRSGSHD